jgi:hypothetical protein
MSAADPHAVNKLDQGSGIQFDLVSGGFVVGGVVTLNINGPVT